MMFRKAFLAGSAALLLAVGSLHAQSLEEIKLAVGSTSVANADFKVADELGLFQKNGLKLQLTVMDSSVAALSAVIAKSVDAVSAGIVEFVTANARGQKVLILADTVQGFPVTLVLSKTVVDRLKVSPTAPVADRFKALDGLTVATSSPTTTSTISFRAAAAKYGARLNFVHMAQATMNAALQTGAVQGFVAGAPFWAVPVKDGNAVAWISGPKGELPQELVPSSSNQLQALREFVETRPATAKKLRDVLKDLAVAVKDRPADVKRALAKLYPDLDSATIDLFYGSELPAWTGLPFTAERMQREIDFLKSSGISIPGIEKLNAADLVWP